MQMQALFRIILHFLLICRDLWIHLLYPELWKKEKHHLFVRQETPHRPNYDILIEYLREVPCHLLRGREYMLMIEKTKCRSLRQLSRKLEHTQ